MTAHAGSQDPEGITVRLFGRFELERAGCPVTSWPQRKTKTLFKLLLTRPRGQPLPQDQLIEALFPDLDPKKALSNLYGRVSELRRVLEPELKQGRNSRYVLKVGESYCLSEHAPLYSDVEEFLCDLQEARELARTERFSQAKERYQKAVALYRGDLLAEDLYEEWTLAPREELRRRYREALEGLAECRARLGEYPQAIEVCRRWIAESSVLEAERAHWRYMLYCCCAGEPERALRAYERWARTLSEERLYDQL